MKAFKAHGSSRQENKKRNVTLTWTKKSKLQAMQEPWASICPFVRPETNIHCKRKKQVWHGTNKQMPGLNITKKKKLKLILVDPACRKWRTNRWAVPACLPLMVQRKPSSFIVSSFFKKLFRALLSSFPVK